jgi:hypothetical protein
MLPVSMLKAVTWPRTPRSPPMTPTMTLSLMTSGGALTVSPVAMLPVSARQTTFPSCAFRANTWPSSVL